MHPVLQCGALDQNLLPDVTVFELDMEEDSDEEILFAKAMPVRYHLPLFFLVLDYCPCHDGTIIGVTGSFTPCACPELKRPPATVCARSRMQRCSWFFTNCKEQLHGFYMKKQMLH